MRAHFVETISRLDTAIAKKREQLFALEKERLQEHALYDQYLLTVLQPLTRWSEAREAYTRTPFVLKKEYELTLLCAYPESATIYVPGPREGLPAVLDLMEQLIHWVVRFMPTTRVAWGGRPARKVQRIGVAQCNADQIFLCFELNTLEVSVIQRGPPNKVLFSGKSLAEVLRYLARHHPFYN